MCDESYCKKYGNGKKIYYKNGTKPDERIFHRTDGPAIEYANGDKSWFINGKYHREDGPACEYANGDKSWYINGKMHREDGPAMEWVNGAKYWYINGTEYCKKEYWRFIKLKVFI